MNHLKTFSLYFGLLTGTFLGTLSFDALASQSLPKTLEERNYPGAIQHARKLPANQVISELTPFVQQDLTPAQWILADAYWRKGQNQLAIEWAYVALVGTQLDTATGCRNQTAGMGWMINAFQPIFREARRTPQVQSMALRKAMSYHQSRKTNALPQDYAWICRINASLRHEKWTPKNLPAETLQRLRNAELNSLINKVGVLETQILSEGGDWDIVK